MRALFHSSQMDVRWFKTILRNDPGESPIHQMICQGRLEGVQTS